MKKISRLYILIIILPFIIGCSENKITDYEDVKEEETENKEEDPEDNNIPVVWTGLRVDGRYLRNDNGEIVNLHGFAQTDRKSVV